MVEYQWGIFWADLDPVRGLEQAGYRPVLVLSAEAVNQVLPVVTVLPLTSRKQGRTVYPIEVLLSTADTGLPKESIAMAHQIRVLSKERLAGRCGNIKAEEVREKIKSVVKLYMDL